LPRRSKQPASFRPQVLQLEDRVVPSGMPPQAHDWAVSPPSVAHTGNPSGGSVVAQSFDLPSGPLTRYSDNPLIPLGEVGSSDDIKIGPRAVLKLGPNDYRMWYESVTGPNEADVGYATSSDGLTWTKQGIVLKPSATWEGGENGEVSPHSILLEDGVFKLWYHSYDGQGKRRIGYATSTDGVNWVKNPDPVLDIGAPGSFDDKFVVEPRVFRVGDGYRMYYGGISE